MCVRSEWSPIRHHWHQNGKKLSAMREKIDERVSYVCPISRGFIRVTDGMCFLSKLDLKDEISANCTHFWESSIGARSLSCPPQCRSFRSRCAFSVPTYLFIRSILICRFSHRPKSSPSSRSRSRAFAFVRALGPGEEKRKNRYWSSLPVFSCPQHTDTERNSRCL